MPRPRLPWGKFWWELIDHPKFAELEDGERWTWVEVWAKSAQLPTRWHFASVRHAAKVTGRPELHIRRLIDVRLLDLLDDGRLVVHDVKQWQEWRYGPAETDQDTDRDAETPAKPPRKPQVTPANGLGNPGETPPETLKKNGELRTETRDRDTDRPADPRVRAHEELDDFLKSLGDDDDAPGTANDPTPESSGPLNLPGATAPQAELSPTTTAVAELPGLVGPVDPEPVKPRAPDRTTEWPAAAVELERLQKHFLKAFVDIGAEPRFREYWTKYQTKYPNASANKLNDWLCSDLDREKARALPPPTQPAIGALVVSAVPDDPNAEADENLRGPRAARELIAAHERQGMVVPEFLRTIAARAAS